MANIERKNNEWMLKSDKEVKNKLDEIRRERIKRDLDKELLPYKELINASFRYEPLVDILKKAQIKRRYTK